MISCRRLSITMCLGSFGLLLIATQVRADVVFPTVQQLAALGASQYELAFMTADATSGTSSNISDYNAFVNSEANQPGSGLASLGLTWNAIVSTTTASAASNAAVGNDIPVFNTNGQLVAYVNPTLGYNSPLYSAAGSPLINPISYDQQGDVHTNEVVWTGTNIDGSVSSFPLGSASGSSTIGVSGFDSPNLWLSATTLYPNSTPFALYGLSSPLDITAPVPEPATLSLLGAALLVIAVARRQRASLQ